MVDTWSIATITKVNINMTSNGWDMIYSNNNNSKHLHIMVGTWSMATTTIANINTTHNGWDVIYSNNNKGKHKHDK